MKYREDIDGLRAVAVIAVVLFHMFPTVLTGGFVGVDMFFVISGYLISSIIYNELDKSSFSIRQFYCRRVRRIFPALITVLVFTYFGGWYLFLPNDYKKLGAHMIAASTFSSNFLLYSESGYFDTASDTKPLLHLWSLGIEEQFYIFWPMLCYIAWVKKLNFSTVTIIVSSFSFMLNVIGVEVDSVRTFYWPTTRAWELLIGACLSSKSNYLYNYLKQFQSRLNTFFNVILYDNVVAHNDNLIYDILSTTGAFLTLFSMYSLTKASVFPGWSAVLPTIGTAFFILGGSTSWINRKILSSRLLVGIGIISYPLYLWHWPLLIYSRIYLKHELSSFHRLLIISLTIILAGLTYICIEKPARFGQFLRIKFGILCVLMVSIGFVGYQTYRTDGLPNRFPPIIRDIFGYLNYDHRVVHSARFRTCHLASEQDASEFSICADNKEKPTSGGVLIWGDSTAAHLYNGIPSINPRVRVTQLTGSACPPIIGYATWKHKHCTQINDYIFRRLVQEKTNTVILAAKWPRTNRSNLTRTISMLKNTTVKNIYLVSFFPMWKITLAKCIYKYYIDNNLQRIPNRLNTCLSPDQAKVDKELNKIAIQSNITYISLYKIFCNSNGCLTYIEQNGTQITSYDQYHLTIPATIYAVSHFPKTLLNFLKDK